MHSEKQRDAQLESQKVKRDQVSGSAPPGRQAPSSWRKRARVLVLAAAGFAVATYLTSYQLGLLGQVWDPIFGAASSSRVLHSPLSAMLPVPDASVGALGYLMDLVLTSIGGSERWRTRPTIVLLLGAVTLVMGLVSLILVFSQLVVLRSPCTLCLASAALSILIFPLAWEEVAATLLHLMTPKISS